MADGAADLAAFDRRAAELLAGSDVAPADAGYFRSHLARFRRDYLAFRAGFQGGRVLEVGAHPFLYTALLQAEGMAVTALDLRPERSRAFIERRGLDVRACDIEAERWPFEDATFDFALFTELLEHLRVDPLFALAELNRVLKPGGRVLLTTPNLYALKTVLRFLRGRGLWDPIVEFGKLRVLGHMGHVREYARRDVLRLLQASGFRTREARYVQYAYPGLFGLAARPLLAALPFLRGYQTVIAEKTRFIPPLAPLARAASSLPG
jgi:SAM-dependent methyltransferase